MSVTRPVRNDEVDVCFRVTAMVLDTSPLTETVFSESEEESTLTVVVTTSEALTCFIGTVMADMESLLPARIVSIGPPDGLCPVSSSMLMLSELRDEVAESLFLSFLLAATWC
jgi:hypothetical protein